MAILNKFGEQAEIISAYKDNDGHWWITLRCAVTGRAMFDDHMVSLYWLKEDGDWDEVLAECERVAAQGVARPSVRSAGWPVAECA